MSVDFSNMTRYNIKHNKSDVRFCLAIWRVGPVRRSAVNHVRRGTEQH